MINEDEQETSINMDSVLYFGLELSPNKKEHYVTFYFSEKHCVKSKAYPIEDETPKNLIFDYSKILRIIA